MQDSPVPSAFESAIAAWPQNAQCRFLELRSIILQAGHRAGVGQLQETLKWGQPSWLPGKQKVGSTLRCAWSPARPHQISLYVNCNTTLAETMRELHPKAFLYEGRRALHMPLDAPLNEDAIDHCAFLTLTYHRKTT